MKNRSILRKLFFIVAILCFMFNTLTVIAEEIWEKGYTEPYRDATLSPAVSGTLSSINHKEGDIVKEGDVILELENRQEKLEVERRKLISESEIEIDSAKKQVEALKLDFEGTRQLFDNTQSVSREELDKKKLEYDLAQAELERLLLAEKREAIEYRLAQEEMNKRLIVAPFDGVIAKVFLEVGENCNPQLPLVRIVDTSKCRFISHIDATLTSDLRPGNEVTLSIENETTPILCKGIIEHVSPVVDPSSGLQEVKVIFDNSDIKVRPGVSGSISLNIDEMNANLQ